MTKYMFSLAVCAMIVLNLSNVSQAVDKDAKVASSSAAAKVEAPKSQTAAPVKAEATQTQATLGSVLSIEKKALAESSVVTKDVKSKKFRKRMPQHYKKLKLTEEQEKKIYAIQQDYFETISSLEGRLLRLRQERDAVIETVLTAEQKTQLNQMRPAKAPKAPKKTRVRKDAK